MEHNQLQSQNSDFIQGFALVRLNADQPDTIDDVNEDGDSSNGGNLDILFCQELSASTLVELKGGRLSHNDEESYGDIGGRGVGDWLGNHNQIMVIIEQ